MSSVLDCFLNFKVTKDTVNSLRNLSLKVNKEWLIKKNALKQKDGETLPRLRGGESLAIPEANHSSFTTLDVP